MLNLTVSFVVTLVNVCSSFLSFIKGPVLLVFTIIIMLASPAEAAVIQCNISDCSMLATSFPEWWELLSWNKKAAVVLLFSGLIIGNILMWHDRKTTMARIKQEEQEWLKKYCS